jgi:hypothetical protein
MKHDIDSLIDLMKRYTTKNDGELDEQDEGTSGGGSSSGDYPSVSHWSEVVGGPTRGKANQVSNTSKWESGLTRGVANQLK